jgi:large subunit ribosomal protein L25
MIVDLQAKHYVREKKGDLKRMRNKGLLPAVIYGHGEDSVTICVDEKKFKKLMELLQQEAVTINIKVEDNEYLCVIKSVQHNPATDQILHIDFQHIHKGEKIKAIIPIHIKGEAPGIKKGGILDQRLHEVTVRCLPADIPSHIDVDISELDLGKTIHLYDIEIGNVEFDIGRETPVISVLVPRAVVVEAKPEEIPEGEEAAEAEEGAEKEPVEGEKTEEKADKPQDSRKADAK